MTLLSNYFSCKLKRKNGYPQDQTSPTEQDNLVNPFRLSYRIGKKLPNATSGHLEPITLYYLTRSHHLLSSGTAYKL